MRISHHPFRLIATGLQVLFIFLFAFVPLGAEKLATLTQPASPSNIYIHNGQLFVADFPSIHVYSMKDFKLIKTFGRQGEGPGEFMRFVRILFQGEHIVVHNALRLAYFSKDFVFQKQRRVPETFDRGLKFMGDHFIAAYNEPKPGSKDLVDQTVNLYDNNIKKICEFYRQSYYFKLNRTVNAIYLPEVGRRTGIRFFVEGEKLFVEGEDGETGNIHVFDKTGKKISTINHKFPKLKVTKEHLQAAEDHFTLRRRRLIFILKERKQLVIPDYFPAIHYLHIGGGRIYVSPYQLKEGKNQFFIMDLEGKLIKEVLVPVQKQDMFTFYPMTISNGILYQLSENQEEDEDWELHKFPL